MEKTTVFSIGFLDKKYILFLKFFLNLIILICGNLI